MYLHVYCIHTFFTLSQLHVGKHYLFDPLSLQDQKIQNDPPFVYSLRDGGLRAADDSTPNNNHIITNRYDRTLDIRHLYSPVSGRRHPRALPDMLDPVFLERGPNFDSLYTKVRDKRTRSELGKLEKEYLRCKKESVKSSSCMVAFVKLYNLAKEISEKMDKMKEIFNDSEDTRTSSDSKESNELKEDVHKYDNSNKEITSKAESSLTTVTEEYGGAHQNSSFKDDEEKIHFSWIIDGQDDNFQNKDITKKSTIGTTPSILPKAIAPTQVSTVVTVCTQRTLTLNQKVSNSTNHGTETAQTKIPKNHNYTSFTHTENESHKISWILDGFESGNETMTMDKPTAKPLEKNKTTEFAEYTSAKTEATMITVHDKPEKISLIIDGHHEGGEEKEDRLTNTTQSSSPKELTSRSTDKVTWSLDENQNKKTTQTSKSTMKIEGKPDRISWIIDGNDDNIVTSFTTRVTSTSTRDIFEELEEVTETVEKEEDKLRKLKYDSIIEEENKSYDQYNHAALTTTLPRGHSTPYLVMNQTVMLTNTTDVAITYGGDCVTTLKPKLEQEKARISGNDRSHILDYPSSVENMLDNSEDGFKPIKQDIWPNTKNVTTSTGTSYDPKVWEELFRKNSMVQQQRDELIDTFEIGDIESMMKFGAKLNSANKNAFQGMFFFAYIESLILQCYPKYF